MLKFLKKLVFIVNNYDSNLKHAHARIASLEKVLAERTTIGVDVSFHNDNHIIVVGRYRNRDYVQTFSVRTEDMRGFIEHLKEMERYGSVKYVDAPPSFKAVIEHNFG